MIKSERVGNLVIFVVSAALLCSLLVLAGLSEQHSGFAGVTRIKSARLETEDGSGSVDLPSSIGNLSSHSKASMTFTADVGQGDVLCLHTVYTSCNVFANGKKIASIGSDETPPFMWDPPTEVRTISLGSLSGPTSFSIRFTTPACRDSLYLYQPVIGSQFAVLFSLSSTYGVPMLISILFLFIGAGLSLLSLAFHSFNMRGKRLLYPGLIALAAGTWQFAENALVVYLVQAPAVLYVLAFAGMMLLVIPIIGLTMVSLDRTSSSLLRCLLQGLKVAVMCAFALQLAGVVQLSQSSRFFSVALPAILITLAIYSYWTYGQTRKRHTLHYAQAITLLAVGAVLELVNYYLRIVALISSVFQLFLLAFVVVTAIAAIGFARHVYQESLQKMEQERNVELLEQSIDAQKQRNDLVLDHERELRRLRHDLRHHCVYLSSLARDGHYEELEGYLDNLTSSSEALERPPRSYCENVVANALISHYADLAEEKGYEFEAHLNIPANMPHLTDGDLCVIVGNLLENAMESCTRVDVNQGVTPFIHFNTRIQGALLFVTLDNSLGTLPQRTGSGSFATSKADTNSHGIGLRSIQAIAQKYDGEATFSVVDNSFRSSLYLTI